MTLDVVLTTLCNDHSTEETDERRFASGSEHRATPSQGAGVVTSKSTSTSFLYGQK